MSAADNGGPAFPVPGLSNLANDQFVYPEAGMTLRDYLAAKAMQGQLHAQSDSQGHYVPSNYHALATDAYLIADAMLKERAK